MQGYSDSEFESTAMLSQQLGWVQNVSWGGLTM